MIVLVNKLDRILITLKEVINEVNNEKVNLSPNYTGILENKGSHVIAEISGGLNGNGKWEDYFEVLSKFCKVAREKYGRKIWLIELNNDCLDDIFYAKLGIKMNK